jgi:hypothetical protein
MNFYRLGGTRRKRFQERIQDSLELARNNEYSGSMQSVIGDYFGARQRA